MLDEEQPTHRANQPVLDVQRHWVEALIAADIATLDTIPVETDVDTDESGSRTDKAGILAALKSGDLRLQSIELLETQVGASAQAGSGVGPLRQEYFLRPLWFWVVAATVFSAAAMVECRNPAEGLRVLSP
jgi:hypothetical protein